MRLALAGDTMLGRRVADVLTERHPISLVQPELAELMRSADATVLNLECCVSERGAPTVHPAKTFHFRAPPKAIELLAHLGVDCVTLANNHALDFGEVALLDTFDHLDDAGIGWVGAGWDEERARAPLRLATAAGGDDEVTVVGFTDHPAEFAAWTGVPGRGVRARAIGPRAVDRAGDDQQPRLRTRHAALGPEHGGRATTLRPRGCTATAWIRCSATTLISCSSSTSSRISRAGSKRCR